jgi:hypothetical protein
MKNDGKPWNATFACLGERINLATGEQTLITTVNTEHAGTKPTKVPRSPRSP